jgi:2-keto-3-deoxy-L-rhamnonate aldolase RhmA
MSARRSFRAALTERRLVGTWIKLTSTESAEMASMAGFDFIVIDMEHGPIGIETAFQQIGLARAAGMQAFVRVPGIDPGLFQRLLDAGADGLVVPHVDDVQTAERVAAAARFPPVGRRGVGNTSRAGAWGCGCLGDYLREAVELVNVIAQLESEQAVQDADRIAAVPGIDAVFLGPVDLAVSLGATAGDTRVRELTSLAVIAARSAGVPIGTAVAGTAEAIRGSLEDRFDFVVAGNDASVLLGGMRRIVTDFRTATEVQNEV